MPCLVGIVAAAGETAAFFELERRVQTAADAAAAAGAIRRAKGNSGEVVSAAREAATAKGFTDGASKAAIQVQHPPASGAYAGRQDAVEATVSIVFSPIVSELFSGFNVTVKARAVAEVGTIGSTCILSLQTSVANAREFRASLLPESGGCVVAPHSPETAPVRMQASLR